MALKLPGVPDIFNTPDDEEQSVKTWDGSRNRRTSSPRFKSVKFGLEDTWEIKDVLGLQLWFGHGNPFVAWFKFRANKVQFFKEIEMDLTGARKISNLGAPTADDDAARKKYVDDEISGISHTPEGTAVKSTGEGGGTKFLREDGDDTCSWQAAPGAGSETKEFFIPFPNPSGTLQDGHAAETLSSTGSITFELYVPQDFSSLTSVVITIIPDNTETIQWDFNANVSAVGELGEADQRSSANNTLAVTDNEITELDISGDFTGIAAGDYIGCQFHSDTSSIRVIGVRFKYT